MTASSKRILWWGVGFVVLGVLARVGYTNAALQGAMISEPAGSSWYYWFFSPVMGTVQDIAFSVGAALIGASIVIRYFEHSRPTPMQQSDHNDHS